MVIKTINNSDKNRYVLSADLNGKTISEATVSHSDLVKGGVLTLKMGAMQPKQ